MKCYRPNCNCDKYKMMGCIFKMTKKQRDLMVRIKEESYCQTCGETLIKANYGEKEIDLCTSCGVRGMKTA